MDGTFKTFFAALALTGFLACSSEPGQPSGSGGATSGEDASHTGGTTAGVDSGAPSTSNDAGADPLEATGVGADRTSDADVRNGDANPDVDLTADRAFPPERDAAGAADVAPADGAFVDGASGDELIHYYGRWNQLTDRAITVNTGSHVVAQFSGTAISARFNVALNQTPNPTLTWRIDQGAWQEGELAASISLGTGLSNATHEVQLMVRGLNENQNRWSPPLVSSITFLGFDVTAGALRASARPVRAKIEFLGDSITEGINVWTMVNGLTTPCWRSDGRIAFPSQTAQLLGAEWRQVGFGRQGLLIAGNGGVPVANDSFNFFYRDVPRDSWQPDMVVINEGTNDGGAAAAAFRTAYTAYISTIRTAYPRAKIAAMRPFNGSQAAPIQAEVAARTAAGDTRVFYVDTTGWLVTADFTDGLHPNVQGSNKAGQMLAQALTAIGLP
jgi:lysophospholipase L1-like esterase